MPILGADERCRLNCVYLLHFHKHKESQTAQEIQNCAAGLTTPLSYKIMSGFSMLCASN